MYLRCAEGCIPVVLWEQFGEESCQRWVELFTGLWREAGQARGLAVRWVPEMGGKGQARGLPLRGLVGTGGTWFGETLFFGRLSPMWTLCCPGMLFRAGRCGGAELQFLVVSF